MSQKPDSMWIKSRTRLLGVSATERARVAALQRRESTTTALPRDVPVKQSVVNHCPAVNYTGVYTRGYSCEHAAGHEGLHRDKHFREWSD